MHWRACSGKAKPRTGSRAVKGKATSATTLAERTVSARVGMHGVGGDRMARSWSDMNQGSRTGKGTAFMAERPEELCPGGDRASVVAKKRVNARGVKGGRKVETMNKAKKIRNTTNVLEGVGKFCVWVTT